MGSIGERIELAHGNGGQYMRELIDQLFAQRLANPLLDTSLDAVAIPLDGELMVTTDGFTVQPLEFPGGDIGSLAVHGTVNDLAVAGALPRYLTLNVFIEEGFEIATLTRLVESMAVAANACGVAIVAGDTKVLSHGECGGLYLATTGIGVRDRRAQLGFDQICPGDQVIISGPVGTHGAAVMLAREEFGMHSELRSDSASLIPVADALLGTAGLRFMRDATRGGVATVLNEIARCTRLGVRVREQQVPLMDPVAAVCELLGFDPLYLAGEGCLVAVVSPDHAAAAVTKLHDSGAAPKAATVGEIIPEDDGVILQTGLGGERVLDELEDDPLPRIC